jgi:secreted trypsin-like serine protease
MVEDIQRPGYYSAENTVAIFGRVKHDDPSTGFTTSITNIIFHERYDPNNNRNDIALLVLAQDVLESTYVQYLYIQPSAITIGQVVCKL